MRTPSLEQPVEFLSGGNQQKVSVSRTFLRKPSVILAYEPTQGVDVGSRFDIYQALRSRTDAGAALLVKSSDPIELSGLCDRVLVMSRGTIIEEIPGDELDERRITEAIVRGPGLSRAGRSPSVWRCPKRPPPGLMTETLDGDGRLSRQLVRRVLRNARDVKKWRKIVKVRLWMPVALQILLWARWSGTPTPGFPDSSTPPTSPRSSSWRPR